LHGCAIFVHQLSSTRAEYQPLLERLRDRGHLLAIDMRGHGASTEGEGGATLDWQQFETADWELVADDVAAAVVQVIQRGADDRCVLIGSSIGSSAVLLAAARHPDRVRALVLLSPGLAYRGVETLDAARAVKVPVLIVHSQEDGAVDAASALAGVWKNAAVPVEVIADPGHAHGMAIVTANPAIFDRVFGFLIDQL
jgi:pimeloyl-ACP methyl ester carboxylesterase